jgi:lipoprotein-releasing system ATP-binding protein
MSHLSVSIATDPAAWDAFLETQTYRPFLQSWTMGEVYNAVGQKPIRLTVEEGGKIVGLSGKYDRYPNQISGGEQQRTAVARALINSTDLILADEPSGNLDSKTARELHALFFSLREKMGQTFIIVTHNQEFADMADRKLEMRDGIIQA